MRGLFSVFAILAAACEPAWRVQGHVRDASAGAVRGAGVALRCPGLQDLAATTDHEGAFELLGRGPGPSLACTVVVASPAYAPVQVPLARVCGDSTGGSQGSCAVAMVDAELRRR
jgi:hypothetical protein